jgi:hypothetical protein
MNLRQLEPSGYGTKGVELLSEAASPLPIQYFTNKVSLQRLPSSRYWIAFSNHAAGGT